MAFKENLERLMAGRGWKPVQLASAMIDAGGDVSFAAINSWLIGRTEPQARNLVLLADVFGVTTDELLRENGDSEPVASTNVNGEE
jgi:transcriptional regulator with XRE-family HTH domain